MLADNSPFLPHIKRRENSDKYVNDLFLNYERFKCLHLNESANWCVQLVQGRKLKDESLYDTFVGKGIDEKYFENLFSSKVNEETKMRFMAIWNLLKVQFEEGNYWKIIGILGSLKDFVVGDKMMLKSIVGQKKVAKQKNMKELKEKYKIRIENGQILLRILRQCSVFNFIRFYSTYLLILSKYEDARRIDKKKIFPINKNESLLVDKYTEQCFDRLEKLKKRMELFQSKSENEWNGELSYLLGIINRRLGDERSAFLHHFSAVQENTFLWGSWVELLDLSKIFLQNYSDDFQILKLIDSITDTSVIKKRRIKWIEEENLNDFQRNLQRKWIFRQIIRPILWMELKSEYHLASSTLLHVIRRHHLSDNHYLMCRLGDSLRRAQIESVPSQIFYERFQLSNRQLPVYYETVTKRINYLLCLEEENIDEKKNENLKNGFFNGNKNVSMNGNERIDFRPDDLDLFIDSLFLQRNYFELCQLTQFLLRWNRFHPMTLFCIANYNSLRNEHDESFRWLSRLSDIYSPTDHESLVKHEMTKKLFILKGHEKIEMLQSVSALYEFAKGLAQKKDVNLEEMHHNIAYQYEMMNRLFYSKHFYEKSLFYSTKKRNYFAKLSDGRRRFFAQTSSTLLALGQLYQRCSSRNNISFSSFQILLEYSLEFYKESLLQILIHSSINASAEEINVNQMDNESLFLIGKLFESISIDSLTDSNRLYSVIAYRLFIRFHQLKRKLFENSFDPNSKFEMIEKEIPDSSRNYMNDSLREIVHDSFQQIDPEDNFEFFQFPDILSKKKENSEGKKSEQSTKDKEKNWRENDLNFIKSLPSNKNILHAMMFISKYLFTSLKENFRQLSHTERAQQVKELQSYSKHCLSFKKYRQEAFKLLHQIDEFMEIEDRKKGRKNLKEKSLRHSIDKLIRNCLFKIFKKKNQNSLTGKQLRHLLNKHLEKYFWKHFPTKPHLLPVFQKKFDVIIDNYLESFFLRQAAQYSKAHKLSTEDMKETFNQSVVDSTITSIDQSSKTSFSYTTFSNGTTFIRNGSNWKVEALLNPTHQSIHRTLILKQLQYDMKSWTLSTPIYQTNDDAASRLVDDEVPLYNNYLNFIIKSIINE
ncbi:hypothetical protein SNEBB_007392 [Seison nebaliae]|nr:hypothetical protein SNEBB_007392 [Seison nebaliae]